MRVGALAAMVVLAACSAGGTTNTSECLCAGDTAVADASCGDRQVRIYPRAGCDVAPICVDAADTGCVTVVCGCDGFVHYDGCEGARVAWRYGAELIGSLPEGARCDGSDGG